MNYRRIKDNKIEVIIKGKRVVMTSNEFQRYQKKKNQKAEKEE